MAANAEPEHIRSLREAVAFSPENPPLARATAGEVNAAFIAVGIHDVLEMWIGSSERNLHGLFEQARRNAPWHLDTAFRRPGRFDRILFVPPPDGPARAAILRLKLRGKPVEDVDFDAAARKAEGFSGADLEAVVDLAVENKLREAMKTGVPTPIRTRDLLAAIAARRPTTREWFASSAIFVCQPGWPRWTMAAATGGLAAMGIIAVVAPVCVEILPPDAAMAAVAIMEPAIRLFVPGIIASQFLANWLAGQQPTR